MTFASPHNTGPPTPSADSKSKDGEPDLSMSALAAASAWSHSHPSEHHSHPHSHLSHETETECEGDREPDTAPKTIACTRASRPLVAQMRDMRVGDIEDAALCTARKDLGAGAGHGCDAQPQEATSKRQEAGSPKKGRTCPNGNSGCSCPFSQYV